MWYGNATRIFLRIMEHYGLDSLRLTLPNAIVPSSTKAPAFKTRQKIESISLETMSAIREAWWDWDDPDSEERQ